MLELGHGFMYFWLATGFLERRGNHQARVLLTRGSRMFLVPVSRFLGWKFWSGCERNGSGGPAPNRCPAAGEELHMGDAPFFAAPLEGGSRKWLWGVAGVALLLLVILFPGFRMGKELGPVISDKGGLRFPADKAGQKLPFRIGEPGRGSSREGEGKTLLLKPPKRPRQKQSRNQGQRTTAPAEKQRKSPPKRRVPNPPAKPLFQLRPGIPCKSPLE